MAPADPEVSTSAGRVRGRIEKGIAVFRGIPFAKPRSARSGSGPGTACALGRRPRGEGVRPGRAAGADGGRAGRAARPARRHHRRMAHGQRLDARPRRRPAAGHGLDLRRRVHVRREQRAGLRRHPVRAWRRGIRLAQLPPRHGGLRPASRRPRQPRPARRGGRPDLGEGEYPALRRRSRQRHRLRRVGRRGRHRLDARHGQRQGPVQPRDRAERPRLVLHQGAGRGHRPGDRGAGRPAEHLPGPGRRGPHGSWPARRWPSPRG